MKWSLWFISDDHLQHHIVNHKLPVHDFPLVYKRHPAKQHQHVAFDFLLAQRVLCILDDLWQVWDHELENENKSHPLREDIVQPAKERMQIMKIPSEYFTWRQTGSQAAAKLWSLEWWPRWFRPPASSAAPSSAPPPEKGGIMPEYIFRLAATWPEILCRHFITMPWAPSPTRPSTR